MNQRVALAMLGLISTLMISNILYHILRSDVLVEQFSSTAGIAAFVILIILPYVAAYYIFKKFIVPVNKELVSGNGALPFFRLTFTLLKISLISSAALLVILAIEIVTTSKFHLLLTILTMQPNVLLTTIIFAYAGFKFLYWFRSNRDLTILFFGLAFLSIALGIASSDIAQISFFLLGDVGRIEQAHANIPNSPGYADPSNIRKDPMPHAAYLITQFPLRIAYGLYWIATAMLLRKYSEKIGKLKFWLLISLPLGAFVVGSIFTYGDLVPELYQGIILSSSALFGGILFGLIFLTIARALRSSSVDKPSSLPGPNNSGDGALWRYLTMSAFGTILFLITNTPTNHIIDWVRIPYPPFADVVWSFNGLASYLYSFGLFFSAISISQNTRLRRSMHELAMNEADMLRSLGKARMHEEIQNRVVKISRQQEALLKEQIGIEQKVTEDEMKQYADEVIREIQKVSRK